MAELKRQKKKLNSFQMISLGFLAVILTGTCLLMLPIASREFVVTPFSDALFTATSAVCVTGLVVQDTATYWSVFGQFIILLLIQIGGLGVITIAGVFAILAGRKLSLRDRSTMQDALSAFRLSDVTSLTSFLVITTFAAEFLGAVLMMPVFLRDFGVRGAWLSVFHSVSAFCNAGFDLMGSTGKFSSLTIYRSNITVNIVIMLLIIIGGIGFLTWDDIRSRGFRFRVYRLQSKVVICTSALLIAAPALYFYVFEFGSLSGAERLTASLFQSVTTRTAGFNTSDLAGLSEAGKTVTIILMLIGGSPGSTAGGMKTTTAAVLVAAALSTFGRREQTAMFGRRLGDDIVKNASTILIMYITLFVTGGIIISLAEDMPMITALFETASAVGTVGLTLGITPELGMVSRAVLIVLMFFGRVGGLTLIFASLPGVRINVSRYPQEKIIVG